MDPIRPFLLSALDEYGHAAFVLSDAYVASGFLALVRAGDVYRATKLLRVHTGMSLRLCKGVVDGLLLVAEFNPA